MAFALPFNDGKGPGVMFAQVEKKDTGAARIYLIGPLYMKEPNHKKYLEDMGKRFVDALRPYDQSVLAKDWYGRPPKDLEAKDLIKALQQAASRTVASQFRFDASKIKTQTFKENTLQLATGLAVGFVAYEVDAEHVKKLIRISANRQILVKKDVIKKGDVLKVAVTDRWNLDQNRLGLNINYSLSNRLSIGIGIEEYSKPMQGKFFEKLTAQFTAQFKW